MCTHQFIFTPPSLPRILSRPSMEGKVNARQKGGRGVKECCIIMAALCLLAGILIGAFIQRVVICIAVGKLNPSLCDKCKWLHTNARWIEADRWAKAERTSRHKK